jgi:hypothetical protein
MINGERFLPAKKVPEFNFLLIPPDFIEIDRQSIANSSHR